MEEEGGELAAVFCAVVDHVMENVSQNSLLIDVFSGAVFNGAFVFVFGEATEEGGPIVPDGHPLFKDFFKVCVIVAV